MNQTDLSSLSLENLFQVVKNYSLNDIFNLCTVNQDLNLKLCQNENFWNQRYLQDFGPLENFPRSWKEEYQKAINIQVLIFGQIIDKKGREDQIYPKQIYNYNIKDVSVGKYHNLFLDHNGQVWSFGENYHGVLGLGAKHNIYLSTKIPALSNIQKISAGGYHNLAIDNDGKLWVFGDNVNGQLGDIAFGTSLEKPEINNFLPTRKYVQISAGKENSLVLTDHNEVLFFGKFPGIITYFPQLIMLDPNDIIQDISINNQHYLLSTDQGKVLTGGINYLNMDRSISPKEVPELNNIVQVSAGTDHSLALDKSGHVWVFGVNKNGQLGLGDKNTRSVPVKNPRLNNIIQISAGDNYSLVLDKWGHVWGFGSNKNGKIGLGKQQTASVPTLIPGLNDCVKISAGWNHSLALKKKQVYTLFSKISELIQNNRIVNYWIRDDFLINSPNVVIEFIDDRDENYLAQVQLDRSTNQIYPPV